MSKTGKVNKLNQHIKESFLDYFEDLVTLYSKTNGNLFGQVTIGLEGDFSADTYTKEYLSHLKVARELANENKINILKICDKKHDFLII